MVQAETLPDPKRKKKKKKKIYINSTKAKGTTSLLQHLCKVDERQHVAVRAND